MNAKELMIGDWVRLTDPLSDGELVQVDCVHPDGFIQYGDGLTQSVEGVPLTLELLHKNGADTNDNRAEFWCLRLGVRWENGQIKHFYGTVFGRFVTIKYVHELQHIMRVCRIPKEIEL